MGTSPIRGGGRGQHHQHAAQTRRNAQVTRQGHSTLPRRRPKCATRISRRAGAYPGPAQSGCKA
eukprot:7923786-Lingulodinium_polyedra.AAC.1